MRSKWVLILALVAIPLLRIISTYLVLSQTTDEPFDIAAGFQWLTTAKYDLEPEHTPLVRIAVALDAALSGARPQGTDGFSIGNSLLERNGRYRRNLSGARAGNLPFFLLGLLVVGLWTRRLFGDTAALISMALFGALPPILGHAGLATGDMAAAATTVAALFLFARWLDVPSWRNALFIAFAFGLGLLSKFSFLIFFPAAAAVMVIVRLTSRQAVSALPLRRIQQITAGALIAFVMVWAAYKFSVGPHPVQMRPAWQSIAMHYRLPAPLFFAGLQRVARHSSTGHAAFLLGQFSEHGWWYYFPVVLFFKTPLAFLVFAGVGIVGMIRSRNSEALGVALAPAAMLLPALPSGINIGVRHVLPLYPLLTICAAFGVVTLWRWSRAAVIILLAWYFLAMALAHPDYISYFNEAAGGHPERIAIDSNLDWGQDLLRLAGVVRSEHIDHLHLAYFGSADWQRIVPGAEELPQLQPVHGWVAISENFYTFLWATKGHAVPYAWLHAYKPVRRVGTSIRLYRIP